MKSILAIAIVVAATQAHADGLALWGDSKPQQQRQEQPQQPSLTRAIVSTFLTPTNIRRDEPSKQPTPAAAEQCTPSLWSDCKGQPAR